MSFARVLLLASIALVCVVTSVSAQRRPGLALTLDSLVRLERNADSLWKVDSMTRDRQKPPTQLASMRHIDLTYDGVPEVLRISGKVVPNTDDIAFTFTIKSGKKTLYSDSWTAKGYFDEYDQLTNETKFQRLRRIITVFFANENFTVLDSLAFKQMLENGTPAQLVLGTPQAAELFSQERVMYHVFASREHFYGLVWLPSKQRFIKAWQN
jgi:sensor c-di-GMP phosphodiesterase-like protein